MHYGKTRHLTEAGGIRKFSKRIVHRRKNEDLSKAVAAEQLRQGDRASGDIGEIKFTVTNYTCEKIFQLGCGVVGE